LSASAKPGFTKKEKEAKKKESCGRGGLWKPPQLRKSIPGGLRQHFLDDFLSCLKKPTPKTLRLFHRYHRPDGNELNLGDWGRQNPKPYETSLTQNRGHRHNSFLNLNDSVPKPNIGVPNRNGSGSQPQ